MTGTSAPPGGPEDGTAVSRPVAVLMVAVFCLVTLTGRYPLVGDETDFARAGVAAGLVGRPVYSVDLEFPAQQGLWHPPLYVYSLGLSTRLLGPSVDALRVPGAIAFALTMWLLIRATRRWYPDQPVARDTAVLLFLACPLALTSPRVLEIDTSWLIPVTLLFLERTAAGGVVSPTVLMTLGSCCKMTTPLLWPGALFLAWCRRATWPRALFGAVICGVAAASATVALWATAARLLDLDFAYPFVHTFGRNLRVPGSSAADPQGLAWRLGHALWMDKNVLLWVGPGLLVLGALGTWRKIRRRTDLLGDLFVLWGTVGGYLVIKSSAAGLAKYIAPAVPLLALAAAGPVAEACAGLRSARLVGPVVAIAAGLRLLAGDPLEVLLATDRRLLATVIQMGLLVLGGTTLAAFLLTRKLAHSRDEATRAGSLRGSWVVLALVVHTGGWGLASGLAVADASRSTGYYYGDRGLTAAARRLAEISAVGGPGGRAVAPKEVAQLAAVPAWTARPSLFQSPRFLELLVDPAVRALVTRTFEYEDFEKFPAVRTAVMGHFDLVDEIGRYRIFARKPIRP